MAIGNWHKPLPVANFFVPCTVAYQAGRLLGGIKKAELSFGRSCLLLDINKKAYSNILKIEEHTCNKPYMPPSINAPKRVKRVMTFANDGLERTSTADAFISNGFWLEIVF